MVYGFRFFEVVATPYSSPSIRSCGGGVCSLPSSGTRFRLCCLPKLRLCCVPLALDPSLDGAVGASPLELGPGSLGALGAGASEIGSAVPVPGGGPTGAGTPAPPAAASVAPEATDDDPSATAPSPSTPAASAPPAPANASSPPASAPPVATVATANAAPVAAAAPVLTMCPPPRPRLPLAIEPAILGIIHDAKAKRSMDAIVGNI